MLFSSHNAVGTVRAVVGNVTRYILLGFACNSCIDWAHKPAGWQRYSLSFVTSAASGHCTESIVSIQRLASAASLTPTAVNIALEMHVSASCSRTSCLLKPLPHCAHFASGSHPPRFRHVTRLRKSLHPKGRVSDLTPQVTGKHDHISAQFSSLTPHVLKN